MSIEFWIPFGVLLISIFICERNWCMLRDLSQAKPQPYSWSKVQLAWWTIIILSSFIAILWKTHAAPTLSSSAVILLGISSLTTATARIIDVSDISAADTLRHQDNKGKTFFLDILSDHNGISISRFQTVIFNLVFGIWFIAEVLYQLSMIGTGSNPEAINGAIPVIEPNNLVLLGLSSATYAALKATENKAGKAQEKEEMNSTNLNSEPAEAVEPAIG